jgi:hypothetical protein
MKYSRHGAGASPCVGDVRPRETTLGRMLVAGLLAAVLVTAPSMALAESDAAEVSKESGLGAAAALSSLFYGPAKILYATGGVIIGGFAYVFTAGDTEVAKKVFTRSLRGDYVITPAILQGKESLEFIGRDLDDTPAPAASVASAAPAYEDTTTDYTSDYDDLGW